MTRNLYAARAIAALVALAFLSTAAPSWCADPAPAARLPVPDDGDVTKSRELIHAAYEADYKAVKESGEPAALLDKLRKAADTAAEPVKKYAFLLEAEDVAAQHDDAAATLKLVDRRAELFEIDCLAERSRTLARLAGPKIVADLTLMEQATATATTAVAAERFDIATDSATLALKIAQAIDREQKSAARRRQQRKPVDGESVPVLNGVALIKSALDLQKRVGRQRERFTASEEAKVVLVKQPDDPAANAVVGTYLCFIAQKWAEGLPYLAKSGVAPVSELAREDMALKGAAEPDAGKLFALANGWWAAGDAKDLDYGKDSIQRHAAGFYDVVLPRLQKDSLEWKLADNRIRPYVKPAPPEPVGDKPGAVVVNPEKWSITLPPDAVVWEKNGNAYKVFTGDLNAPWDGAKERCANMGGHLVFINSPEEQAFVRELLKATGDGQRFLAGATNTSGDRKWRWGDSSLLSFTAWAAGQPSKDNTEQSFLHLDMAADGAWRGGPAASEHVGFVCEWERPANGQNVAVNPSFEAGAEPHWLRGEGTMIVKDKKVRTGEAACVLSSDGYAGVYQDVPVTWGDKVTVSLWAEPHLPLGHSGAEAHMGPDMWKEGVGGSIRTERVENGWNQYTATFQIPARETAPTLGPKTRVGMAFFMRGCKPVHVDDFEIIVERGADKAVALPAGGQAFTSYRLVAEKSNANGWEAYYRTIELFDAKTGKPLAGGKATGTGTGAPDAFDGDRETSYRSVMNPGVEGDWIAYELPNPAAINRVRIIQWGGDGNHVYWLELQGSNDGDQWTPVMKAKGVPDDFDSADPAAQVEWLAP